VLNTLPTSEGDEDGAKRGHDHPPFSGLSAVAHGSLVHMHRFHFLRGQRLIRGATFLYCAHITQGDTAKVSRSQKRSKEKRSKKSKYCRQFRRRHGTAWRAVKQPAQIRIVEGRKIVDSLNQQESIANQIALPSLKTSQWKSEKRKATVSSVSGPRAVNCAVGHP